MKHKINCRYPPILIHVKVKIEPPHDPGQTDQAIGLKFCTYAPLGQIRDLIKAIFDKGPRS